MTNRSYIDHDLIARIEGFLSASRMSPTAFGRKVGNDGDLLADLKGGRELRRKTREKIEAFIASESKSS